MFSVGMKLYNAMGREVIINDIQKNTLHVVVITKSIIKFNNGKESTIQEFKKNRTYSISDLGTQLFFDKEDIGKSIKYLLKNPLYSFNKDNMTKYFEDKNDRIMDIIKSEAPKIPMSSMEKERIIKNYNSKGESAKEEKDFYDKNYKTQNYFARIDFDTEYYIPMYEEYHKEHYYEKFYIGKRVRPEFIASNIIDWRSEIASMYYDREKTNFIKQDVGIYNSEIMLRRSFKFNPNSFQNIYIANNDLYEEGSVDPFLLEVLEENRSNHMIGDIIKSIQANQNKIIRQKSNTNIIVQGCAGSGKTMILLHRLSYLKFNKKLKDLSKVKIIIPNYLFTLFFTDISDTLELKEIECMSINDYYIYSIKKYKEDYNIRFNKKSYNNAFLKIIGDLHSNKLHIEKNEKDFSTPFVNYIEEFYNKKFVKYKEAAYSLEILTISNRMFETKNIEKKLTNNDLLDYLYKISDTELLRKNSELKQKLVEFNNKVISINGYLDSIDMHNYEIMQLGEKLREKELKTDLWLLDNDDANICNYIVSDVNELIEYISNTMLSPELKFNELDSISSVNFKKSKLIFYECFNTINNYLMSFTLNYIDDNLNRITDMRQEYKMILEKSQNICNSRANTIGEFKEIYTNDLNKSIQRRDYITKKLLKEEEINILEQSKEILTNRKEFIMEIWFKILEILNNKNVDNENKSISKVFILLNLLYLHYGSIISKDNYLFIDEGQDYALEEYKLINNINNGQAIINIYGDVNQSLNKERKIENWKDLKDVLGGDYYELNENYRNTIQITKFCNKKFGHNHNPIGMQGPDVVYINKWEIENIIDIFIHRDNRTRIAIIKKNNDSFLDNLMRKYEKYKDKSIIIGDVKKVKGLEFDTVFVFPENMNNNELYISYSRSLNMLYIIR